MYPENFNVQPVNECLVEFFNIKEDNYGKEDMQNLSPLFTRNEMEITDKISLNKVLETPFNNLVLIDTGIDVYLCKSLQSKKIQEIYNQVNVETFEYSSDIIINEYNESVIFNTFKNIQNTFNPNLSIEECIENLKYDINTFVSHYDIFNNIKKKYIKDDNDVTNLPFKKSDKIVKNTFTPCGYEYVDNTFKPWEIENDNVYAKVETIESINNKNIFQKLNINIIKNNVLYLKSINTVVVMSDSFDYTQLLFSDIIYIGEINNCLRNTCHAQLYDNLESFKEFYKQLQESKIQNDTNELGNVSEFLKEYISNSYDITDKQEHRIKSSVLYNKFITDLKENIQDKTLTLSLQSFSNGLISLGLKKKRYADGFYYYGLSDKQYNVSITSNVQDEYNKLLESRDLP
jgi:hypothetical protein